MQSNKKECDFSYLDELIQSKTGDITLDCDIVLGDDEAEEYLNGIWVNTDDITIDGCGHSIDAKGKARIFEIIAQNIKIKNITFKNGFSEKSGGAIANAGTVTIEDSIFSNNEVKIDGGAIYNDISGKMSLSNTEFIKNRTQTDGAGIFNWGDLRIDGCIFKENLAESDAGAIHNGGGIHNFSVGSSRSDDGEASKENLKYAKLIINNTKFIKNTAKATCGGVVNWNILRIKDSIFEDNNAKSDCNTIWNHGKDVLIENTSLLKNGTSLAEKLIENSGNMTVADSTIMGAAIQNKKDSEMTLRKCSLAFSNKILAKTVTNSGHLMIYESEFSNCRCRGMLISNFRELEVEDVKFNNNKLETVITNNNENSNMRISNCEFDRNNTKKAVIENKGNGGLIENSSFRSNHAPSIINDTNLTIRCIEIENDDEIIVNRGDIRIAEICAGLDNKITSHGNIIFADNISQKDLILNDSTGANASYSSFIKIVARQVAEGIVILLVLGFIGFHLGFLGIEHNELNRQISLLAPMASVFILIVLGMLSVKDVKNCGGIFENMPYFKIYAILSFVEVVLFFVVGNFIFLAVFPDNFTPTSRYGINHCTWLVVFTAIWYLYLILRFRKE